MLCAILLERTPTHNWLTRRRRGLAHSRIRPVLVALPGWAGGDERPMKLCGEAARTPDLQDAKNMGREADLDPLAAMGQTSSGAIPGGLGWNAAPHVEAASGDGRV